MSSFAVSGKGGNGPRGPGGNLGFRGVGFLLRVLDFGTTLRPKYILYECMGS